MNFGSTERLHRVLLIMIRLIVSVCVGFALGALSSRLAPKSLKLGTSTINGKTGPLSEIHSLQEHNHEH